MTDAQFTAISNLMQQISDQIGIVTGALVYLVFCSAVIMVYGWRRG